MEYVRDAKNREVFNEVDEHVELRRRREQLAFQSSTSLWCCELVAPAPRQKLPVSLSASRLNQILSLHSSTLPVSVAYYTTTILKLSFTMIISHFTGVGTFSKLVS